LWPASRAAVVVDLVVPRPGGGVAHAELAFERQGRQPRLGLADQVDRQEPQPQRQLGVLHQAARGQRGLVAAALALEKPARTVADDVVLGAVTAWAAKARGPAGGLEHSRTCSSLQKQAMNSGNDMPGWNGMKLNAMVCTPRCFGAQITGRVAQGVSLLRHVTNQVEA